MRKKKLGTFLKYKKAVKNTAVANKIGVILNVGMFPKNNHHLFIGQRTDTTCLKLERKMNSENGAVSKIYLQNPLKSG